MKHFFAQGFDVIINLHNFYLLRLLLTSDWHSPAFNENSGKSKEHICEEWEITETNNWIRILIFEIRVNFSFSQPVP